MKTFGDRLKELRKARGWTLAVLAEKVGCDKSYLSAIERGRKTNPSLEFIEEVSRAFGGVPRKWLESGLGDPRAALARTAVIREAPPTYCTKAQSAHIKRQLEGGPESAVKEMPTPDLVIEIANYQKHLFDEDVQSRLAALKIIELASAELRYRWEKFLNETDPTADKFKPGEIDRSK